MKRETGFVAVFMIMATAGLCLGQEAQPRRQPPRVPTLTVGGHGQVYARPDRAVLRFGATVQSEQAADAQNQVNAIMQKAISNVRGVGIPEERIQTSSLTLQPVYSQPKPLKSSAKGSDEPRIVAYRAGNVVTIQVDDLTRVGAVIDAAVRAEVNRLEDLQFQIRDDSAQRRDALRKAVLNAREKAEAMADALGVELAGVIEIQEGGVQVFEPRMQFGAMRAMAGESVGAPVQPGEIGIDANVTIRYRLSGTGAAATR